MLIYDASTGVMQRGVVCALLAHRRMNRVPMTDRMALVRRVIVGPVLVFTISTASGRWQIVCARCNAIATNGSAPMPLSRISDATVLA